MASEIDALMVVSFHDPLWQEWMDVEARVWEDGPHPETATVALGKVRRGVLRQIIDEFRGLLAERRARSAAAYDRIIAANYGDA